MTFVRGSGSRNLKHFQKQLFLCFCLLSVQYTMKGITWLPTALSLMMKHYQNKSVCMINRITCHYLKSSNREICKKRCCHSTLDVGLPSLAENSFAPQFLLPRPVEGPVPGPDEPIQPGGKPRRLLPSSLRPPASSSQLLLTHLSFIIFTVRCFFVSLSKVSSFPAA